MNVFGDPRRMPVLVVEDEHPDAARLPVPHRGEHGLRSAVGPSRSAPRDRRQLTGRPRAEERDRDVQVLLRNEAGPLGRTELVPLPARDAASRLAGQAEAEKEP